ncbi:CAP domain-containing protein [Strongyloides ratti]|uniref:CAP domain-containing protein n=1 Tax=Strongyloides ratti TaxID=34506 RepID=A0A090LLQ1_STRRB|nr:CAP domain-containing protein [Strongyloides ratti]CEF70651.1 CAP domain-containing protein [Strongyloides ratti]
MEILLNIIQFFTIYIFFINSQFQKSSIKRERNSWNGFSTNYNENIRDKKSIIYYLINDKVYFECNGYIYKKHSDALQCCKYLNSGSRRSLFFLQLRGIIPNKIRSYINRTKIAVYDYKRLSIKNSFTRKIWYDIWKDCNYKCFSSNNFKHLKEGLLNEINEYRKIHKANPLVASRYLNILAHRYATRTSLLNYRFINPMQTFNIMYEVIHRNEANHVLKYLFDEFINHYNYNNNIYCEKYSKQTQIIWKSTSRIGIGVMEEQELIYIVIIFLPKGNINNNYRNNISPISQSSIHIYRSLKGHH